MSGDGLEDPPPAAHGESVASLVERERRRRQADAETAPIAWMKLEQSLIDRATSVVVSRTHAAMQEARDAIADALIRLAERRSPAKSPVGLLVITATNLVRSHWRREAIRADLRLEELSHDGDYQTLAGTEEDFAARVAEEDERSAIRERLGLAVGRLSDKDRNLIREHYRDGKPLTLIDAERGERIGSAKMRLCRARRRLRDIIDEAGELRDRGR